MEEDAEKRLVDATEQRVGSMKMQKNADIFINPPTHKYVS